MQNMLYKNAMARNWTDAYHARYCNICTCSLRGAVAAMDHIPIPCDIVHFYTMPTYFAEHFQLRHISNSNRRNSNRRTLSRTFDYSKTLILVLFILYGSKSSEWESSATHSIKMFSLLPLIGYSHKIDKNIADCDLMDAGPKTKMNVIVCSTIFPYVVVLSN